MKSRLAVLGTEFTQNLLADERDWFMPLAETDLEGLPEFVVAAAREAGREKGQEGPVVTLSRSLIVPFLQFSARRDLRETAYKAWAARGMNGGETDNRGIAAEVLALRAERAMLLGYDSFAAYKLETEMAGTPEAVRDLLMAVWEPARTQAEADAVKLTAMLHSDGINGELEPWDWRYYSEKRRAAEHDLNEAELKPYFQLDAMIEAAFDCANRLFGLEFAPLDVPTLPHRRARMGGDAGRQACRRFHRRLFRARIEALGRVVLRDAQPEEAGRRRAAHRGQCLQFRQGRALSAVLMTTRGRCSTNSAMRYTRCCRT